MSLTDEVVRIYGWDRFPRARTVLSLTLALPVIVMGFLMAFSFEGPLRFGPYLLCLVALSATIARPCNRATVVAIAGPMSMSMIGAIFVVFALSMYSTLATLAAIWRRISSSPYGRPVWPDFPPGRLRQVSVATTIACSIAGVWILVASFR